MEQIVIVGIQSVDFTDDTGRAVNGLTFFFTQERDNVTGMAAGKVFVSAAKYAALTYKPAVGDRVRVFYNRYGKPEDFELVEAA